MTPEQFNELLERKLSETRTVLAGKADEYAHGGDRLSNFKRAAGLLNCTPESALLGFVTKHITALYDFVAEVEAGRCMTLEQWAEKTGDIRNYMLLLDALVEERLTPAYAAGKTKPEGWSKWAGYIVYYCACGAALKEWTPKDGPCPNCGTPVPLPCP